MKVKAIGETRKNAPAGLLFLAPKVLRRYPEQGEETGSNRTPPPLFLPAP